MNEGIKFKDGFYPTPPALAEKLCELVLTEKDKEILEPSAGKGDLVDAIRKVLVRKYRGMRWMEACIDVIEIDPELRGILKSKYSEEEEDAAYNARDLFKDREKHWNREKGCYENLLTENEKVVLEELQSLIDQMNAAKVRVCSDDFLSYQTMKRYDAIIMNPPFDQGDLHLLKALELVEYGGKIACILNAETIRNPYTNSRKLLVNKLEKMGATITFHSMEFAGPEAERKTSVEIAMIHVDIQLSDSDYKSAILEGLNKAKEKREEEAKSTAVFVRGKDWIDDLIAQFQYECEAGIKLYHEYIALKPFLNCDYDKTYSRSSMIELKCGSRDFTPNEFVKMVRSKYWNKFFTNPQFSAALTSNLQATFRNIVDEASDYDFTRYNIDQILGKMQLLMMRAREQTILQLFEKLSQEHSQYEGSKNIHFYNGWKTNKAWKINEKKVIIPIHGAFAQSWKHEALDTYSLYSKIADIEKVFNYLAVGADHDFIPLNLESRLQHASESYQTRNIHLTYFDLTLYKKGTAHISFHPETAPLIERLNLYASQKKGWLPPGYGSKNYDDFDEEARAVINSFNGGREEYEAICNKADFYLSDLSAEMKGLFLSSAC